MGESLLTNFKTMMQKWFYTEEEVDTLLDGKSDAEHTHTTATATENGFMSSSDKSKLTNLNTQSYYQYENEVLKSTADWYVSTEGSDSNAGTTEATAVASLSSLVDKVESGDNIYIFPGTYSCTSGTVFTVPVNLYSNPLNPAVLDQQTTSTWLVSINPTITATTTIEIKNIIFTSSLTSGQRFLCHIAGINEYATVNVTNCQFSNSSAQYNGHALEIGVSGGTAIVESCIFYNNTATAYGHIAASCTFLGTEGTCRVYNSIFNNPKSYRHYYCNQTGASVAMGLHNSGGWTAVGAKGSGNQFLGAGDTCRLNYTEE